jgi:hypothetical protein
MDLYKVRKTPDADTWEIYNAETDQVVDTGAPTEADAKKRAEMMNEMVQEVEEGAEE